MLCCVFLQQNTYIHSYDQSQVDHKLPLNSNNFPWRCNYSKFSSVPQKCTLCEFLMRCLTCIPTYWPICINKHQDVLIHFFSINISNGSHNFRNFYNTEVKKKKKKNGIMVFTVGNQKLASVSFRIFCFSIREGRIYSGYVQKNTKRVVLLMSWTKRNKSSKDSKKTAKLRVKIRRINVMSWSLLDAYEKILQYWEFFYFSHNRCLICSKLKLRNKVFLRSRLPIC